MIPEPHHEMCVQNTDKDAEPEDCDCETWRLVDFRERNKHLIR